MKGDMRQMVGIKRWSMKVVVKLNEWEDVSRTWIRIKDSNSHWRSRRCLPDIPCTTVIGGMECC